MIICKKENFENITIRDTSYILNKRTAKKIGFQVAQTDFFQSCILIYNYFNLLVANLLAKSKLTFPSLGETQTFEARLYDLKERKDFINGLNKKLKQRQMV